MSKTYGLIIPKKGQKTALSKPLAFSQDSDDDQSSRAAAIRKEGSKSNYLGKQVQIDIEKALAEDPHCFDYDGVYDQEHSKIEEEKVRTQKDRRPRFINDLMSAAENKKKRNERVLEKKVQKEREAEGNMYADKESFVTGGYRGVLEARKEEEEKERQQQALEELMDQGQRDYPEFIRHVFNKRVGNVSVPIEDVAENKSKGKSDAKRGRSSSGGSGSDRSRTSRRRRKENSESPVAKRSAKRKESPKRRRQRESSVESRSPSMKKSRRDHRSEASDRDRMGTSKHHRRDESIREDQSRHRRRDDRYGSRKTTPPIEHSNRSDKRYRRNSPIPRDRNLESPRAHGRSDRHHLRRSSSNSSADEKPRRRTTSSKAAEPAKIKDDQEKTAADKEAQKEEAIALKRAKRNVGGTLDDAKARYLARKAAESVKPIISLK